MEEPFFPLEIDFSHERNIATAALSHVVSLGSYYILIKFRLNMVLTLVSDHLNLTFWVVGSTI